MILHWPLNTHIFSVHMHSGLGSSVSIGTGLRAGRLWFVTGSGAHPASYPIGTGSKTAGAWNWLFTSI